MTAPLKADQQAAERVLKAAVRRAVTDLREGVRFNRAHTPPNQSVPAVVDLLATATTAAALLLDERPAKKAAARKGAS